MISIAHNSFPAALPAVTGEGISDGTRSSWQASDLNGLFDSHLSDPGRQSREAEIGSKHDAGKTESPSPARSSNPQVSASREGEPDAASQAGAATSGTADRSGVPEPGSVSVDAAETFQLRASTAEESSEETASISLPDGSAEGETERPVLSRLVLAGEEAPDLYVRDGSLNAESAVALTRAAGQLLQQHRVVLGRVKINGQHMGADGEESSPSS